MSNDSELENKKYQAFISYRHADNTEPGREWATWLHQSIEKYVVPSELVGKPDGRGGKIPPRIFPVFRDEQALPANADLANSITGALDNTNMLIVLCSPNARASTYVADEIDYFKKLGHSDRIIAAMINGEPNTSWDTSKHKLGFSEQDECFPIPLQFKYDENGQPTKERAEPIAADFRINNDGKKEQGWTSPIAYRQQLKKQTSLDRNTIERKVNDYEKQLHLMLLKVIAGILGIPLDDLTQRDKEYQLEIEKQKARTLRKWLFGVFVLAIIAIAASIFAFINEKKALANEALANQQKNSAQISQSTSLMQLAQIENEKGNYDKALLIGLSGISGDYGGPRPAIDNTDALKTAIKQNRKIAELIHNDFVKDSIVSSNEKYLAVQLENNIEVWSLETLEILHSFSHNSVIGKILFTPDSKNIVSIADNTLVVWNIETGTQDSNIEHSINFTDLIVGPNNQYFATISKQGFISPATIILWQYGSSQPLATIETQRNVDSVDFNLSGKSIIAHYHDQFELFTVKSMLTETYLGKGTFKEIPNKKLALFFYDETADLVSTDGAGLYHEMIHESEITSVEFNVLGTKVLIKERSGQVTLWSIDDKNIVDTFFAKEVTFNQRGDAVYIYEVGNNTLTYQPLNEKDNNIVIATKSSIRSVLLSKNPEQVFVNFENHMELWNVSKRQIEQTFYFGMNTPSIKQIESHDLLLATFSSLENDFYDDKTMVWTLANPNIEQVFSHENIDSVDVNVACQKIVSYSHHLLKIWSSTSNKLLHELRFTDQIFRVSSTEKGCLSVVHFLNDNKKIVDLDTSEIKAIPMEGLSNLELSSDGQFAYRWEKGSKQYNILAGKEWNVISAPQLDSPLTNITVSPTDNVIAVTFSSKTYIVDIPSLEVLQTIQHEPLEPIIKFSPDGQLLVATITEHSAHGIVYLWSTKTGRLVAQFEASSPIYDFNFNQNMDLLATTTKAGDVYIWSIPDKKLTNTFSLSGPAYYPQFGPQDKTLLVTYSPASVYGGLTGGFGVGHESRYAVVFNLDTGVELQAITGKADTNKATFIQSDNTILFPVTQHQFALINTSKLSIHDEAIAKLPKSRTCLTPSERYELGLDNFTDEEWDKVHCKGLSSNQGTMRMLLRAIGQNDMAKFKTAIANGVHFQQPNKYGAPVLNTAIQLRRNRMAIELVKLGANPNSKMGGKTPLMATIQSSSDAGIVKSLIDSGADVNATSSEGSTALHLAVQKHHTSTIEELLEAGALVDMENTYGYTPLDIAIEQRHEFDFEILKRMLSSVPDLQAKTSIVNRYIGFISADDSDKTEANQLIDSHLVELLLSINKSATGELDEAGNTSLMKAIANDNNGVAIALMSASQLNLNQKNDEGMSALLLASRKLQLTIIETLLNNKVKINAVDNKGMNALHHAIEGISSKSQSKEEDNVVRIRILKALLKSGINQQQLMGEHQISPLTYAVMYEQIDTVSLLLEAIPQADLLNQKGMSALGMAKHMKSIGTKNMEPIIDLLNAHIQKGKH